jgi:hypothetical protein
MKSQEYKDLKNQIKVLRKDILEQIEGRSFVSYKLPNVFNMEWVKEEKTKKSISDGRVNKTQEKTGLIHITDAQGYLISYHFPVRKYGVKVY